MRIASILWVFLVLSTSVVKAQLDTVIFNGKDRLVGEVKGLDNSVMKMETEYSEVDFSTEWVDVTYIRTASRFVIVLSNGIRFSGRLQTDPEIPGNVRIFEDNGQYFSTKFENVVGLRSADKSSWDRLKILLDGGYSLTAANDVQQYHLKGNVGYITNKWLFDGNFNIINSTTQDTISSNRRTYGVSSKFYPVRKMFLFISLDLLESEEQDLNLRTNYVAGLGTSLVRTQKMKISLMLGGSFNQEDFITEGLPNQSSMEGYGAFESNFYGYDNFSMFFKVQSYPSLTERGRIRTNLDFNLKYDLPLDFYIMGSTTLSYDNKPQGEGNKADYTVQSGLGWEF